MELGTEPLVLDEGQSTVPQIYDMLRTRIVRTELRPGMLLSESEIARVCGVSRQPVREAFIKLVDNGLVMIKPQRGTMVTRISQAQVLGARFVREAIEAEVVRTVATRPDPGLVRNLAVQLERQVALRSSEVMAFMKLDELFHRTLVEAAGQPYAWGVLVGVKAQIDRVRYLTMGSAGPVDPMHISDLIAQHSQIFEAIRLGEPEQADAALRAHLREILRTLPVVANAYPELFT